jgi:uncharacterized Zn finger protein
VRPQPYRVTLQLPALTDAQWEQVVAALVAEARFCAQLLAGEMPRDVDAAFRTAGVGLFPRRASELGTDCSCPDWANPCKHVAAVHFVLADAFDRDPFLLFEIRGRTRDQVLDALRAARSRLEDDGATVGDADSGSTEDGPPAGSVLAVESEADFFRAGPQLDDLHFHPSPPDAPLAVLRRIGTPPSWTDSASPDVLLGPVYAAASREALRRAQGDAGPPGPETDAETNAETDAAGRILELLRVAGPLGFREIEDQLGAAPRGHELRRVLRALRAQGRVVLVGRTRSARYHVAGNG